MSDYNILYEHFNSINDLLSTIQSRPVNSIMECRQASKDKNDEDWFGTETLQDAYDLLQFGDKNKTEKIKLELLTQKRKVKVNSIDLPHRKIQNEQIGYIPNIPNFLSNKPNNMINIVTPQQKRKTLHILYDPCIVAYQSQEDVTKAGIAIVIAINLLELSNISTKLSICCYSGQKQDDVIYNTLTIKNYGERFNLMKLAFPFSNASFLRRIGFRYLETLPTLTNKNFAGTYGKAVDNAIYPIIAQSYLKDNNAIILTERQIRELKYDINEIIKYINTTVQEKKEGKR